MMWAATIPRISLKEMGTNGPWNWKFTVPKTIKVMLARPLMANLKITVRDDYAVPACSHPPYFCLWKLVQPLLVRAGRESAFGQMSTTLPSTPPVAGIWNKANFPFHQPGLLIDFWMMSSWTPETPGNITSLPPSPHTTPTHLIISWWI